MVHNVLFVDEDEILLFKLKNFFSHSEFIPFVALNGREGIEICKQTSISVVVLKIYLKNTNSQEFIFSLQQLKNKPIIIIYSYDSNFETIVEMIRSGAFNYIHKSTSLEKLQESIQKAIDVFETNLLQKGIENQQTLEKETDTLKTWKEIFLKRNSKENISSILENLRTAFTQGSGFGTLISVIKRIQKKAQRENGYYKIPENLMEMLFENANTSERVIDLLKYHACLSSAISCKEISIQEIYSLIFDLTTIKMQKYSVLKNQKIVLGENNLIYSKRTVYIDLEFFSKVVEELLFNAFKFSVPNSKIFILFKTLNDEFIIEIINSPELNQNGILGIPNELSELIFEPFFRISKFVYPEYPTLDFGLGLTFIKEVITHLKGKIIAKNITGYLHLHSNKEILTLFQIYFPLKNESTLNRENSKLMIIL